MFDYICQYNDFLSITHLNPQTPHNKQQTGKINIAIPAIRTGKSSFISKPPKSSQLSNFNCIVTNE